MKPKESRSVVGFLVSRYSIMSGYPFNQLSDDSLGDTPVPMPNTVVKP